MNLENMRGRILNFIPLIPGNEWLVYRLGNELVVKKRKRVKSSSKVWEVMDLIWRKPG